MKLYEYEGKELFRRCDIDTPRSLLASHSHELPVDLGPSVVKAQVRDGDRKRAGGIILVKDGEGARKAAERLIGSTIRNEKVTRVLVEERMKALREYYVSFSFDGHTQGPVLAVAARGGTGITRAHVVPIDLVWGSSLPLAYDALLNAKFPREDIDGVSQVIMKLWNLFISERALLSEINPLFKTRDNRFIAGDSKVILDDNVHTGGSRRVINMDGDIAVLASGGGASMLNMDALIRAGGKPANYTEYSGNPSAEVVKELTLSVLTKPGLKGCWVVGAAANFTDIHTTLSGFLDGLRTIRPQPIYPIVIRRDGPRREEAFKTLKAAGEREGFDFHLYDSETPMIATAKIMVDLAYGRKGKRP